MMNNSVAQKAKKQKVQLHQKMIDLFASILTELAPHGRFETIQVETLKTMTTLSAQNARFKNLFLAPTSTSQSSKKVSLLKIVVDKLANESQQGNSQRLKI